MSENKNNDKRWLYINWHILRVDSCIFFFLISICYAAWYSIYNLLQDEPGFWTLVLMIIVTTILFLTVHCILAEYRFDTCESEKNEILKKNYESEIETLKKMNEDNLYKRTEYVLKTKDDEIKNFKSKCKYEVDYYKQELEKKENEVKNLKVEKEELKLKKDEVEAVNEKLNSILTEYQNEQLEKIQNLVTREKEGYVLISDISREINNALYDEATRVVLEEYQILSWRYKENLSFNEIADRLGVSAPTVRKRIKELEDREPYKNRVKALRESKAKEL